MKKQNSDVQQLSIIHSVSIKAEDSKQKLRNTEYY